MPRYTHPRPRVKHSRDQIRFHRDRYVKKRRQLAKALYGDSYVHRMLLPGSVTDEVRALRHVWPFNLEPGRLHRNPFTVCSCLACTGWKRVEPRRARERRAWQQEVEEERRALRS